MTLYLFINTNNTESQTFLCFLRVASLWVLKKIWQTGGRLKCLWGFSRESQKAAVEKNRGVVAGVSRENAPTRVCVPTK